jgi:hypothetical protein
VIYKSFCAVLIGQIFNKIQGKILHGSIQCDILERLVMQEQVCMYAYLRNEHQIKIAKNAFRKHIGLYFIGLLVRIM